jgi:hypothetical protein
MLFCYANCYYAVCGYDEWHKFPVIMMSVMELSVVMLSIIIAEFH